MSKPATLPTHDTNGTLLTTPPAGILADGYQPLDKPSAGWFNWLFYWVCQWLAWLDIRTSTYTLLETMVAGTAIGETAELAEADATSLPGSSISNYAAGGAVLSLAADGLYVYVARAAVVTRYTRAGASTGVTYTPTNAGTVVRVVCNGEVVVVAYGNYVEAFEITGASRWVVNHGAQVRDVCLTATFAYMVGAISANIHVRALGIATGALSWSYRHSAAGTVWSVASDGRSVFIASTASSYPTGANMRALNASNGRDAAADPPAAVADADGLAWDRVSATDVTSGACLAVDDERLYVGYQTAVTVEARAKLTGEILATVTPPAIVVVGLAIDQDFLVVGGSANQSFGLAKKDLSTAWRYNGTGAAIVTSDGAAAWIAYGSTVYRVARGNRTGRWLRVAPSGVGHPYRWLAIPQR
jgi:hypothetical protein